MKFYVYTHARPDGSIFYVGKGTGRRARDFSPRRRTAHHRNIALKYGLSAILIDVFPAETEAEAFRMERQMIADLRSAGVTLINLTNGGEGASGSKATEAMTRALQSSRGPWDQRSLTQESRDRMLDAITKGRIKCAEWRLTEEGRTHIRSLGLKSAAATAARTPIQKVCDSCGGPFETRSLKNVRWCSKLCGLRGWRAKRAALSVIRATPY